MLAGSLLLWHNSDESGPPSLLYNHSSDKIVAMGRLPVVIVGYGPWLQ
jgi:hypothetical protein